MVRAFKIIERNLEITGKISGQLQQKDLEKETHKLTLRSYRAVCEWDSLLPFLNKSSVISCHLIGLSF
jgi:hypothetical protein